MTTAREKLFQEIVALAAAPMGASAESDVRKIMARYRVQTKPGIQIPEGVTARDALGERILLLWRESSPDFQERVGVTIDEFRMQTKMKAAPGRPSAAPPSRPRPAPRPARAAAIEADTPAPPPPPPAAAPVRVAPAAPAEPRVRRTVSEPVAGGPKRRGKTRSECPKCHSMGVVLARSYAGDEYFSCIYCGWQAFRPADDSDPAASLAFRLLGQSFSEK